MIRQTNRDYNFIYIEDTELTIKDEALMTTINSFSTAL